MQPSHLLSQRDQDPGLPVSWLVHWRQRKFFTWSMQASVRGCFLSSRSFTKFLNCCSSSVYFCEVHLFSNEAKEERKKAKGIGIHTHTHTHTHKRVSLSATQTQICVSPFLNILPLYLLYRCCCAGKPPEQSLLYKTPIRNKTKKIPVSFKPLSLSLSLVFPYSLAS